MKKGFKTLGGSGWTISHASGLLVAGGGWNQGDWYPGPRFHEFRSQLQFHPGPQLQNRLFTCDFYRLVSVGLSAAAFSTPSACDPGSFLCNVSCTVLRVRIIARMGKFWIRKLQLNFLTMKLVDSEPCGVSCTLVALYESGQTSPALGEPQNGNPWCLLPMFHEKMASHNRYMVTLDR